MLGSLVFCLLLSLPWQTNGENPPKIAIIGAGIGGTSTAYHLSQQLPDAKITVFESGKVGGRLATVQIGGREYESGGSIIHPANRLMVESLKLCGLEKAGSHESESFSVISGGEVIFQNFGDFLSNVRMMFRYGIWSLFKMKNYVDTILENFDMIYQALDDGKVLHGVKDILDVMSPISKRGEHSQEMYNLTKISLKEKLENLPLSKELVSELVTIATKVNYGQFVENMHAFVGTVSLAGVQDGLWRVNGGNYKVPECLLKLSRAKMTSTKVQSIEALDNGYKIHTEKNSSSSFDMVVLATPMTSDKKDLELLGLPKSTSFPGKYQRTLAYFIEGTLNSKAFGSDYESAPTSNIFFIDHEQTISSLSLLTPVDYNEIKDRHISKVYKIFSREPLSRDDLGKYFSHIESHIAVDWLAYPNYETFPGVGEFEIHKNLFYLNNIEWAASAMEMSALAGKNIANLITSKVKTGAKIQPKGDKDKVAEKSEL